MNRRTSRKRSDDSDIGQDSAAAGEHEAFLDFIEARHKALVASPGTESPMLIWVVLNHWQTFRDRLGMRNFDRLVRELLERFRSRTGPGDRIERFGEAALALVVHPESLSGDGSQWAEAALEELSRKIPEIDGRPVAASVSIGLSPLSRHRRKPEETLLDAVQVAERLSREGRSQFEIFEPGISASQAFESQELLVELLRESLRENRIQVMSQPMLGIGEDQARYFQVWARPVSRDGELIPASRFINLTGHAHVLSRLELWVLAYTVRLVSRRRSGAGAIQFFVHLTPRLLNRRMLDWFRERLKEFPELTNALILEFALDDVSRSGEPIREALDELTGLGLGICLTGLDETGFADPQIHQLPAQFLRMTDEFVHRYCDDSDLAARFGEFIKETHGTGKKVIMAGVRDEQTMIRLWKINVDLVQGDFIQPPQEGSKLLREL